MSTKPHPDAPRESTCREDTSDELPARVYWVVALFALGTMAFLHWLTASVDVPLAPV